MPLDAAPGGELAEEIRVGAANLDAGAGANVAERVLHQDVGSAVEAERADVDGRRPGQRSRPALGIDPSVP
jgi:hypothetical protein